MATGLKIGLAVGLTLGGTVMLVMGEDAPLEGEGLIMQFLPKRVVGLAAIALALVLLASLASPAADHLTRDMTHAFEKQHSIEDWLGAAFGVPFTIFWIGVVGGVAWSSTRDGHIVETFIFSLFALFGVLGFFMDTWYLHLTGNPVTFLRQL